MKTNELCAIRRDVGGREESATMADLPMPPMLVRAVRHRYDVTPFEVQLARFLRREVIEGLD